MRLIFFFFSLEAGWRYGTSRLIIFLSLKSSKEGRVQLFTQADPSICHFFVDQGSLATAMTEIQQRCEVECIVQIFKHRSKICDNEERDGHFQCSTKETIQQASPTQHIHSTKFCVPTAIPGKAKPNCNLRSSGNKRPIASIPTPICLLGQPGQPAYPFTPYCHPFYIIPFFLPPFFQFHYNFYFLNK
jgi:hypothetical protein